MKITTRLVLQHFLAVLLKQLQEAKEHPLNPFFSNFFTKEEITQMIRATYGSDSHKHLKMGNTSKEILLSLLSDRDVLLYFLEKWNTEIETNKSITALGVMQTLEQLGHQTHYLASKAIACWDQYDFSNYKSLCRKAGKTQTIYGIYDIDVKMEDVEQVTSHPKRFYETYDKASLAMQEMMDLGKLEEDEQVHVLPRLVGDA